MCPVLWVHINPSGAYYNSDFSIDQTGIYTFQLYDAIRKLEIIDIFVEDEESGLRLNKILCTFEKFGLEEI